MSAFFSSSETALTMANKVRLKALADEGNRRAKTALRVLEDYGKMLTAILIGNNIVNIAASSIATIFATRISISVGVVTSILTVAILIFAEIVPKNISTVKSENLALAFAGIINVLMILLTPVIFLVDIFAKGIMKLLRIDTNEKNAMTESELRTYLDVSHEDGVIEDEEKEMIINVFDFGDSVAKDIMIPKVEIIFIEKDSTFEEVLSKYKEHMYTRYPVYDATSDNILGVINVKDLLLVEDTDSFKIEDVMRPAYFTFEYKKTADLLPEMRAKAETVAFVLNEYGSFEGMVTLEDLLEEIVGEIRDEYDDREDLGIKKMEENAYLVEGSMKLDDINDEIGTTLSSENYDSIGGLVIDYLEDRLPEDGETIKTDDGIEIRVLGVDQNRIQKVVIKLPSIEDEEKEEESE
ncbi:MAG: hemolysin family protein [Lachnospiraceae bacterium]|nr:hemolysin family protein [Lachnospiraceae bacterium]